MQWLTKKAKVVSKLYPSRQERCNILPDNVIICQSWEISPNLVTLAVGPSLDMKPCRSEADCIK